MEEAARDGCTLAWGGPGLDPSDDNGRIFEFIASIPAKTELDRLRVLGVDAYRTGWVAVEISDDGFEHSFLAADLGELIARSASIQIIAVDIPIGLPSSSKREADVAAAAFVGPRRSSVFPTPPRHVLEATTFAEAVVIARDLIGVGISQQAYALRHKILEVDGWARTDDRIREVHPEVSFAAMKGSPLEWSKKSYNGVLLRRTLLQKHGIEVPAKLQGGGVAPIDDVFDAAAAGWSARRIASGEPKTLPDPPEKNRDGRVMAIWY